MRYYYISYAWRYCGNSDWHFDGKSLKDIHPLDWLLSVKHSDYKYTVISWQELTASEYERINGKF